MNDAGIVVLIVIVLIIIWIATAGPVVQLPLFLGALCLGAWWTYYKITHADWYKQMQWKAERETQAAALAGAPPSFPSALDFSRALADEARRRLGNSPELPNAYYEPLVLKLVDCYNRVFVPQKQNPNWTAEYNAYLNASVQSLIDFTRAVHPHVPTGTAVFTVPLRQIIGEAMVASLLETLAKPFQDSTIRRYFTAGVDEVNHYDDRYYHSDEKREKESRKFDEKMRDEMGIDAWRQMWALNRSPYMRDTGPIHALFSQPAPFPLDQEARFHHTWVISPTGTGKTNLLENLILYDIHEAINGKATVIVLDSQLEFITHILSTVNPNCDKVVYLEPSLEHPLALNIFDSQAINYAKSQELADFVLSALATKMTEKQGGLFRFLAKAMQVIPNATIMTLVELLRESDPRKPNQAYLKNRPHILKLDSYSVDFFENRFNSSNFAQTKAELSSRLDIVMSEDMFRTMFTHPRNRLNLAKEIDQAKIILVNTNPLADAGRELLGRFIIAMVDQATENRLATSKTPMPVYFYIDECHDYIANEPKIAKMTDKIRKQRVAMTFAHQRMKNIPNPDVMDALASARVKFVGKMETDQDYVAKRLHIEPEVLTGFPKDPPFKFAVTQGAETVILTTPKSSLVHQENEEWVAVYRRRMIARYCAPPGGVHERAGAVDAPAGGVDPMQEPQVEPIVAPRPRTIAPRKPRDDIELG